MNSIKNDPITTEIIQSSLQAACDEMFVAMRKTAMSSIIYEVLDFGTAVTDSNGNIAASGAGIPAFIAMCDKAVQAVIKKYDSNQIKEGDVFATNDPYNGGVTHLNDVIVVMPVFSQGERIAQLILEQCNTIGWVEVEELEDSVRSDGGFGSTGS